MKTHSLPLNQRLLTFLSTAYLIILSNPASSEPVNQAPVKAKIIWQQEFNQSSTLDSSIWSYDLGSGPHHNGWGNNELQKYTDDPANIRIENGNLIITAIEQSNENGERSFTSARIKTEDKLTFMYATLEARIKIPDLSNGLWPAFWTLGNNISSIGWPNCGEIDIMEMGHYAAITDGIVNRRIGSTAHWENDNQHANYGLIYDATNDINGNFHTYRLEWTPKLISTYIDEQWIWSIDISDPDSFDGEEFHQAHFLLLNLAVGGGYTRILEAENISASFPAEYTIDYIRILDNGFTKLGGSSIDGSANKEKNNMLHIKND